jgi:hypothetical protein
MSMLHRASLTTVPAGACNHQLAQAMQCLSASASSCVHAAAHSPSVFGHFEQQPAEVVEGATLMQQQQRQQ